MSIPENLKKGEKKLDFRKIWSIFKHNINKNKMNNTERPSSPAAAQ